ncbi:germination protein, Ger(X)C family [Schinkia azotoformans MEV2011]|uniref:Germination protein, Ger(X)C family n=1 Tax=Schinkia azotoformans MEV2011 TaxID=1348973 RepID=A0A072NX13_SCHAZ|nr:Ger(x)C family spore germination protein [Schinkia azotoformans]KEF37765.1 germination protein, Ger(X)C family [Schinkia azotoformans MEV2011]MEC1695616.1 Ger(x)C family spore germination protein [Schinkia azotoformans]MEC1717652.1 Ger(x)C family spore germination protein [Schinkia azotoformans]MEC1726565.1 Ger(x)C family spore germination protein [Schinkia azotoformans]MEC1742027.1 Ger(x)C family spore germination protein [Schinkia azotoformans]
MKKFILFVVLLGCSFAPQIAQPKQIIDDIFLVMAVGYDYVAENRFTGTAVAPFYKPDKTIENLAFSNTSSLIYQNRDKLESESSKPLINGKLQIALFNRELAEKTGIFRYIDNLQRDPNVGARIQLAVFDGSTEKTLHSLKTDEPIGTYLSNLVDENTEFSNLPLTNLHTFEFAYYSKGIDPILPLLEEKKNRVKIKGVALFKKEKMVDFVPQQEFFYLRSMYENFKKGVFFIKLDNGERAFLTNIASSRKFVVKHNNGGFSPNVTINIKVKGIIREYSGPYIPNDLINDIERQIEKDIKKKNKKMLTTFQELGIDPIGIGHHVRHQTRNYKGENWEDIYPNVDVKVKATVSILERGVIK